MASRITEAVIERCYGHWAALGNFSRACKRVSVAPKRMKPAMEARDPARYAAMVASHTSTPAKRKAWDGHGGAEVLAFEAKVRAELVRRRPIRTYAQMSREERQALEAKAKAVLGRRRPARGERPFVMI